MSRFLLKPPSPHLISLTSGLSTLIGHLQGFGAPQPKVGWPKEGVNMYLSYKSSKVALNMVMLNWQWLLKADGFRTRAISPGFLATNLGGGPEQMKAAGAGDVWVGGDLVKKVVEGERDADAGKGINQNGKVQDW